VEKLDYILLTHIHLDHSGGLPPVLTRYPMAKVVCHSKAVKHLVDPSSLWSGSLASLGSIAREYGIPEAVPTEKILPHFKNMLPELTVLETPGHAAHHLSFVYGKILFPGEAGGIYLTRGDSDYLRPATPSRFDYDIFMESLGRLLSLEDMPICFSHFDEGESSQYLLGRFREQMILWKGIVYEEIQKGKSRLEERCLENLLQKDDNLKTLSGMNPFTQEREKFFLLNSIKGFLGYFKN
jgi:glyoxylase-like metal-dependent hydrolase (beta-lactamase superfamily II)